MKRVPPPRETPGAAQGLGVEERGRPGAPQSDEPKDSDVASLRAEHRIAGDQGVSREIIGVASRPTDVAVLERLADEGRGRVDSPGSVFQTWLRSKEGRVPQVTRVPVWRYTTRSGLTPPSHVEGSPPGCVIARPEGNAELPKVIEFRGATYSHLRNGFYIGNHATDRDIGGLFETLAPTYERNEINVDFNLSVYEELALEAARARGSEREVDAVLDFGCGTGVGTPVLERRFPRARALGFDLSPAMRALAEANGMTAIDEKDGRLLLEDASVDLAVGAFVLHLVRDPAWIDEIGRILRPGGAAAFNVYKPADDWRAKVEEWFRHAGFEIVQAEPFRFEGGGTAAEMPLVVARKPVERAPR